MSNAGDLNNHAALLLCFHGETADIIKQNQTSMLVSEGSNATLSCTYGGNVYSLHWYQQKPGSRPEFLLLVDETTQHITKAETLERLSVSLNKQSKTVDLEISSAAVSDSAFYYCALFDKYSSIA
uniref:Ig-like domain-containing protein n=1 Tax=Pygocentrus nattereri TaxID=42514 RepID=A0A3B4CHG5_PYGNA